MVGSLTGKLNTLSADTPFFVLAAECIQVYWSKILREVPILFLLWTV